MEFMPIVDFVDHIKDIITFILQHFINSLYSVLGNVLDIKPNTLPDKN